MLGYRSLPLRLAATLAAGLPETSRSKLKLAGLHAGVEVQLLASIADTLNRLEWNLLGRPGHSPPRSILTSLNGGDPDETGDVQSYDSAADFDAALAALKGG